MLSPSMASSNGHNPRHPRYLHSPTPSKRMKIAHPIDPYERFYPPEYDPHRLYTSICVKNLHPKLSDSDIRDLCAQKFSKYGNHSVRVYYKDQERMAFVNFSNWEDAKRARHATSGLIWENIRVNLEPVYYRRTMPAELPYSRPGPSPPPPPRKHYLPPPPPPPPLPPPPSSSSLSSSSSRPSRRRYSPYIPLPPDLVDYVHSSSSRSRQRSSVSPSRRHEQKKTRRSRSRSRSRTSSASTHVDEEPRTQNEPSRILIVEQIDRDVSESKLREIFGRYGTIEQMRVKRSKRVFALIHYENVDMAHRARQAMNGHSIGKTECRIGYGQVSPTRYLWVGNIPLDMRRRDLEHAFARYGQIKSLEYANGDPTAIITYNDVEDAVKARSKLLGTIQLSHGKVIRNELNVSPSSRRGFRIDYLDRPTIRRFVIVRPRTSASPSPARSDDHPASPSPPPPAEESEEEDEEEEKEEAPPLKTEPESPKSSPVIKQRRSTDRCETPISSPTAGRTFYPPLGSYLSSKDTEEIHNVPQLLELCEQLNLCATQNSTALSTVYPVQFILKSHGYDARMHFLAGSPTLASLVLGQPGDLVAAKTELRITQRLRLDQHKLDDLERNLRSNVISALNMSQMASNRTATGAAQLTKFVILIGSPSKQVREDLSPKIVKTEASTPPSASMIIKEELIEKDAEDDESSLSRLISYLITKEAAGVISIPFYPTSFDEDNHSSKQDVAVLHIFPPCHFTEKILTMLCPNFHPLTANPLINNEHLMLIIVHND